MPKVYEEDFKKHAVSLLELLNFAKGTIVIKDTEIKTVRDLVKYLGISSWTLYEWRKEIKKSEEEE